MHNSLRLTVFGLNTITLLTVGLAQNSSVQTRPNDDESLRRATRTMQKLDTNGNGSFERNENANLWKRYRMLDKNGDKVISIDELRQDRSGYLNTDGDRKLDVVYKQVAQKSLHLDLYYPPKDAADAGHPLPIVVYTHGGGWAAGSKQGIARGSFKAVFEKLLQQGFAVASVEYRLCRPNTSVTMRDCVIDCKDAIRYLTTQSKTLNLDSSRVFVMGDSAGGHIAQMLTLTPPKLLPGDQELAASNYTIAAGVSWYGPCDFEKTDLFNHDDRPDFRDRFGPRILGANPDPATKLQRYREMSPINYVTSSSPPLLLIQGDKDTTIPVKHANYMKEKAEETGAPIDIMIVRNAGHNWRKVDADIDPTRDEIVDRTVQFFTERVGTGAN